MSVLYRRRLVDLTAMPDWLNDVRLVDYPMHMFYAAKGTIYYFNRPMGVYRQSESAIWSMAQQIYRQEMALLVRLHLLDYFAEQPIKLDGLRAASKNILAVMIAEDPDNEHLQEVLPSYAHRIDPTLSIKTLKEIAALRLKAKKPSLSKRILRTARIAISRMIPIPRPPKIKR